jgi:uncharacterized protein (DUF4415 family)
MKKSQGSSAHGRRTGGKGRATGRPRIDYSDIPALTDAQLKGLKRVGRPPLGALPRKAISIRIDEDVLDWLKCRAAATDKPYQSLINEILGRAMRRSA